MSNFTCTVEQLKKLAVELLKEMPSLDVDGLDNGVKCFNLHYLGVKYEHEYEETIVLGLVRYVHKKYSEAVLGALQHA